MPKSPLIEAARAVREQAYVPYSNFKVGAAIRTPSGAVFAGCNVENVAYPEGTCAEAGAIAAMAAAGEYTIETDEELIEGLSFPAYRRILTLLCLQPRPCHIGLQWSFNLRKHAIFTL